MNVNTEIEDFEGRPTPGPRSAEDGAGVVALKPDLTPRQLEILLLIARGRSNKEIAALLGISQRTVKFHVASLLKKLCAFSRTEALVVALRLRLIELDSAS